jgi:hypothetical protein
MGGVWVWSLLAKSAHPAIPLLARKNRGNSSGAALEFNAAIYPAISFAALFEVKLDARGRIFEDVCMFEANVQAKFPRFEAYFHELRKASVFADLLNGTEREFGSFLSCK